MPFLGEQDRLAHPWAVRIPRYYFGVFFHFNYKDEYTAVMQAPLSEALSPANVAAVSEEEKSRYFLCVACGHPEISNIELEMLVKSLKINSARELTALMSIRKDFLVESIVDHFKKYPPTLYPPTLDDMRYRKDNVVPPKYYFDLARETGNLDALKKIHELAPDHLLMLVKDPGALHLNGFIDNGNQFETVDWLIRSYVKYFYHYQQSIMRNSYHAISDSENVTKLSQLFEKLCAEKLQFYRDQKAVFSNESETFDIKDKTEREYAFIILMDLIRKNNPANISDIQMLVNIPSLRSMLFEKTPYGNVTDLIKLARDNADQLVLDILPTPVNEAVKLVHDGAKELRFNAVKFADNEINAIVRALEENENKQIQVIDFSSNWIDDKAVTLLAQALSKYTTLKSLNIVSNPSGSFAMGRIDLSEQLVSAFEKLLENNKKLTSIDLFDEDYAPRRNNPNPGLRFIYLYLDRNKVHSDLDNLSERLMVSVNFQENISDYKEKKDTRFYTPYFDLIKIYDEMDKIKYAIQKFAPTFDNHPDVPYKFIGQKDEYYGSLMDRQLSITALFHRRAMDTYHRDTSIDRIDPRILAAEKCLASIKDKDSLYYKEACHEIGSYYAECASVANTEEDKKAFNKTALNFWKSCLYDREFMASPAGDGFELRFAILLSELLPNYFIPSPDEGVKLISDKTLIELDQKEVANAREPADMSIYDFNIDDSLQETVKMAAKESFILLLDKLSHDISHHPNSRHVGHATLFAMPTALKQNVVYSQALNMLKDLMQDKNVDKNELMEKIDILSKSEKLQAPLKKFIESRQAEWVVGKSVASVRDFVDALYDKQVAKSGIKHHSST